jgi:phenylacetate-CoA ligase
MSSFVDSTRSWVTRNVLLRAGDLVWKQGMIRRLSFLEEAQWWPRERVLEYRNRQLRTLLEIAYNQVPFYRSLFDQYSIDVRNINSAEQLRQLPIVTKSMLTPQYPTGTTRNTGQKTYETSSSGSTGKNFRIREDSETAGQYRAAFMLALGWAGWQVGESHMQTGIMPQRSRDRRLKDYLLRCHYVSAYRFDDQQVDAALDALEYKHIRHLWGYPGSLYHLAKRASQRGWNRSMKTLVTWGDNLYPHYRSVIESVFGNSVFDTYGCGEGFQIAAQCGNGSHYHLQSLDIIAEFLGDDGNPVPEGELGNIVITRLHPGPMPLIRYRVGDMGIPAGQKLCACGRGFEMMKSVQGRDTDIVVTPAGNRLVVHFFTGLIERFEEVDCFQVVQNEISSMIVRLVPARTGAINSRVEEMIRATLREYGADLQINIEIVSEIPLAVSGKRRFVINNISPQPDPVLQP